MFVCLRKSARTVAGRLAALIYLFCVLAPGVALALGSGPTPCFDEEIPVFRVAMTHQHAGAMTLKHGGTQADRHADASGTPTKHTHHGKDALGPCCALMCVSAIPAELVSFVTPSLPVSICVSEAYRSLYSEGPPQLYRPPIA